MSSSILDPPLPPSFTTMFSCITKIKFRSWTSSAPHAVNGLGVNRVEQIGFCFGPHLVWWEMVGLAIRLIWFGFIKKIVWFGLVVALLKLIRNRVETLRL